MPVACSVYTHSLRAGERNDTVAWFAVTRPGVTFTFDASGRCVSQS